MLSLNANWLKYARRSVVKPIYKAVIDFGGGTTRTVLSDEVSFTHAYPISIEKVSPFAIKYDVIERQASINEMTTLFKADGWARDLVVNNRLKGKTLTLSWGFYGNQESEFESFYKGAIDKVLVHPDKSVEITIKNGLGVLRDTLIVGQFWQRHPLQAINDVYTAAGAPLDLVDTTTLDPAAWLTISHFVISRAALDGSPDLHDIAIRQPTSAFELMNELAQLLDGLFVDSENGKLRFVLFDSTTAAVDSWTDDDIIEGTVEQETLDENVLNSLTINFGDILYGDGHNSHPFSHQLKDSDSITNFAYPGTSGQEIAKVWDDQWINGFCLTGTFQANPAITLAQGAGTTFFISMSNLFAMSGLRWSGSSFPSGSQPADAALSASRTAFYKVDDEFIEVDLITFVNDTANTFQSVNPATGVLEYFSFPWVVQCRIKTRGALGTAAAAHNVGARIVDYTIPVYMLRQKLTRFSNGAPIVHLSTRLDKFSVQLGDLITLVTSRYAAFGSDGLDANTKWEVIGKEVDIGETASIKWTLAWATKAAAPAPTQVHRGINIKDVSFNKGLDATKGMANAELWDKRIVSGLGVTAAAGLTATVAIGSATYGMARFELTSALTVTFNATKDTYVYIDFLNKTIVQYAQTIGTAAPVINGFGENLLLLAKVTTDGASVTTVSSVGTTSSGSALRAGVAAADISHQKASKSGITVNPTFGSVRK